MSPFALPRWPCLAAADAAETQGRADLRRPAAQRHAAGRRTKQSDFARDTVKVLKKHRIPPSYGFINADKLERNPDGAQALQIWIDGGHPLAQPHLHPSRPHQEQRRGFPARNPAQRARARTADAPDGKAKQRLALVPLSLPARRRHARETPRGARLPRQQRLPHRADHLDFGRLPLEQRARALLDKKDAAITRMAARELPHAAARGFSVAARILARQVFGRDIHHVMLLHLGSFSSHILPDLFELLERGRFRDRHAGGSAERSHLRLRPGHRRAAWRHAHRAHA